MVYINPANVINLLVTALHISSKPPSPVNHREIELSEIIHTMILDSMNEVSFTTDYVTTLEYEDLARPQEYEFVEEGNIEENVSSNEFDERCVSGESGNVDLNYKSRAVEFWRSGEKTRRTLDSVQHKFRKVKSVKQLYQWEETLARGGTRREKILSIVKYVLDKFQAAMNQGSFVHDMDIKQWTLEAKEDVDLPTFKAGHTWIMNFKKAHNIVSRKVTKFISRSTQRDKQQLQLTSTDFVNRVKPYIAMYNPNNVYNADESGFNLEIHSGRTLSYRGRKTIEASVQSVSSTTHSYTILPTISASGHLLSPLFMVLKETSGEFGPRVEESLFRPANVYVTASKSGKLTSHHFNIWLKEVFLPKTGLQSVLLLDSWSGHCPSTFQQSIPADKELITLTIPKGTTGLIQPLDVYGFRVWKNFVRTFSDRVLLYDLDINLHLRNNIIKLQSLTHNQLSSPRFRELFKYSWYKSGYLEQRPDQQFENPVDFCFKFPEVYNLPRCNMCDKPAIIRCACCKKYLCIEHFFDAHHLCENYVE
ncbi:uncharacterized protein LOC143145892 [Ptiloglossa arizonensis]|uniref:uncharacterized protein LOC143145892 n=1 Tax=Ptiloglossa arizonensis TaxID=3350558 RepID=UPI003F9F5A67